MTNIAGEKRSASLFPVVAAALVDDTGRVLVQQRPPGKQMAGLWEFPGGKVETGETPEDALVRELNEELGIVVDPAALNPATFASEKLGDRHLLLLLYVCRSWSGDPAALDAVALKWVTLADMRTLAMPPADAPFIAALERMI
jgi:8-oxo-dGTP diphosphatase